MLKKTFLSVLISMIIGINMYAEWIPVTNNKQKGTAPKITMISDNDNSTVFKIEISGFNFKKSGSDKSNSYESVDLLTDVFMANPDYPKLPYISKVLAIPNNASASVEVIETGYTKIFENINIEPALKSWQEGKQIPAMVKNQNIYNSSDIYPKTVAQLSDPSVFRDFRIVRLSVYPLRYLPAKKQIQVVSSVTVRINYNKNKGKLINPKTTATKKIAPSFGKLYRSFISNYQSVLDAKFDGVEGGHDVMLCIMPDEFVSTFEAYAEWKNKSGVEVHITKFSDINANANNPITIKEHIKDAYQNWENPPTYILVVGDDGIFPDKIMFYDGYSYANEDFFVEVEGDDFFPEMMIGRLTNDDIYHLEVMLNKFMKYEKEPYIADNSWFKKGICGSNNLYESQIETKRFTAKVMKEDGGFTTVDTLMSDGYYGSGCSMDISDITNAINEGRSFLNYRGEGWTEGWSASCYSFNVNDVSQLDNGEKLTFVTSIGCGVSMFDASEMPNSFGEEWLELGTPTQPKGAIAFVGPTSNTHTTYNNRIDKGIYVGMFREGMKTPGQVLLRGKLYMYNRFGASEIVEYQTRVFTVLGDPSVQIWKAYPQTVNVSHPASVPVGLSQSEFNVTFASTGNAVKDAQIYVTGEGIFAIGTTDSNGKAIVQITPETACELTVLVRGGNVIPKESSLTSIQNEEQIGPTGEILFTEIEGNSDDLINPNEKWKVTYTLKNWGGNTAPNVKASLSVTNNQNVTIETTTPVNYGNIETNAQVQGDAFNFFIKPEFQIIDTFSFKLHMTSDNNSWDFSHNVRVTGCQLKYQNSFITDKNSSNPNFRLDKGETVNIFSSIVNLGEDIAKNVKGVLRCNDQYIEIIDSIGSFGTLDINDIKRSDNDYFILKVKPNCPDNYDISFKLKLSTQNGNYPYTTEREFILSVGSPQPTDITGPDSYGYYALSNSDMSFDNAPEYNWTEIEDLGNKISIPQNINDYTKTVTLPFTFKYYGKEYNKLQISVDGWMAFGEGNQTAAYNTQLPNNDNIDCMIAVFWDDLYNNNWPDYIVGDLFYYYNSYDHSFIVEWSGLPHDDDEYEFNQEYFQAILLDPEHYTTPTGDGEIVLMYKKLIKRNSCTIGIEDDSQNIGLQYVFNNSFNNTASPLNNKTAIKFTTKSPDYIISINKNHNSIKDGYKLHNYPNPFSNSTTINYIIPELTNVNIAIYNLSGQLVATLNNSKQTAGSYTLTWDGYTNNGINNSGLYLCRLQTDKVVKTIKMFFLKEK